MLRRKFLDKNQDEDKTTKKKSRYKNQVLGRKNRKYTEEDVLESLVLGTPDDVIKNLKGSKRKDVSMGEEEDLGLESPMKKEKKPVWEDEDDTVGSVKLSKARKYDGLKHGEECKIRTDQYTTRLKSKFEKVSANPNWAKYRADEPRKGHSSDDDSDVEDLVSKTGNYLVTSRSLTKGVIQIKQCPNANKESSLKGKLNSVEFHPSAQVILTAGSSQTLSLFQVDGKNNPKIQSVFLDNFPIFSAHFTTDGREVVLSSKHKSFYYYDMIAGKVVNVPKVKGLEKSRMERFVVSPDGRFLVFRGSYGDMHILSAKSKEWIDTLKMNGSVECIAFSKDGGTMYSHGDDGQVYIWDMTTRDCVHHFTDEGCTSGTSITASPNGQYLACGSYSGVVNIYETETCRASRSPKPLKAVMNLTTACTDAVFHPSSEILALSSNLTEKALKLVHLPSLTVFSNYPDRFDQNLRIPLSMDFSPNGGYFSVGTHKGSALLYRVKHYGNY